MKRPPRQTTRRPTEKMIMAWRMWMNEGKSYAQIARELGVSKSTIQNRVWDVKSWYAVIGR